MKESPHQDDDQAAKKIVKYISVSTFPLVNVFKWLLAVRPLVNTKLQDHITVQEDSCLVTPIF